MTSDDIQRVLSAKHVNDVYVPECKTGASDRGMQIMDAWVMAKSWAHPLITAYEIKVSRQDFLRDNKWRGYLDYCNAFYFACPKGLIKPEELPTEVGLIWISDNKTTAYTKRKAVYRNIVIPQDVFRYILMGRVKVGAENPNGNDRHYWLKWLEDKKLDYEFGWRVSKTIRETVEHKIKDVEKKNRELELLVDRYRDIKSLVNTLGFDEHAIKLWGFRDNLTSKLQEIKTGIGKELIDSLTRTRADLDRSIEILSKPVLDGQQMKDDNAASGRNVG